MKVQRFHSLCTSFFLSRIFTSFLRSLNSMFFTCLVFYMKFCSIRVFAFLFITYSASLFNLIFDWILIRFFACFVICIIYFVDDACYRFISLMSLDIIQNNSNNCTKMTRLVVNVIFSFIRAVVSTHRLFYPLQLPHHIHAECIFCAYMLRDK